MAELGGILMAMVVALLSGLPASVAQVIPPTPAMDTGAGFGLEVSWAMVVSSILGSVLALLFLKD
ncbi:hypothetical protein Patl1_20593 [Pistacia atlantica]|uniref:Uncharacterized protein n=1 Tax=Pistacia atlantica TaxID=434234 RepID=A0ACC1BHX1_9ROSI|nr:hypothetical protein Patl1_20593 [Pistacia atlantica]